MRRQACELAVYTLHALLGVPSSVCQISRLVKIRQEHLPFQHASAVAGHGTVEALAAALRLLCSGAPGALSSCRQCAPLLIGLADVAESLSQVSGYIQRSGDIALGRDAGEVAGHGAAEALAIVPGRLDGRRLAPVLPQAH